MKNDRIQWRSLEELIRQANGEPAPASEDFHEGFAPLVAKGGDGLSRRGFLQVLGAGGAAAGLSACSTQYRRQMPYTRPPEGISPSNPVHYATAILDGGLARGVIVTAYEGRPTKVEGNPDHPASLGATTQPDQATLVDLYDEDRAKLITEKGQPIARTTWWTRMRELAERHDKDGGASLRFLLEPDASPLLGHLLGRVQARWPNARVVTWDPVDGDGALEASLAVFGRAVEPVYDFTKADVVVSLDADFLGTMKNWVRWAHDWAERRVPDDNGEVSRLYVAEAAFSLTGANADHRLRLKSSEVLDFALALANAVGQGRGELASRAGKRPAPTAVAAKWVDEVTKELLQHKGRSIVLAGPRQPAAVHALAHAINELLGNVGASVSYQPALAQTAPGAKALTELAAEMAAGKVDTLVVGAWNPAYTAPADLDFEAKLGKVPNSLYLSLTRDETSRLATWHLPALHRMESWGDARAYDGTATIVQPLISPLFDGLTLAEVLATLLGEPDAGSATLVKTFWLGGSAIAAHGINTPAAVATGTAGTTLGGPPPPRASRLAEGTPPRRLSFFEWEAALQRGLVDGTAMAPLTAGLNWAGVGTVLDGMPTDKAAGLEVNVVIDPRMRDGRHANNAWLQEMPEPITKMTWGNAAIVSIATAQRLGVESAQMATVTAAGKSITLPVVVQPGLADDVCVVWLGYGRRAERESISNGIGVDVAPLRTMAAPWFFAGSVARAPGRWQLAITQEHSTMDGRALALTVAVDELKKNELPVIDDHKGPEESYYSDWKYEGHKWGMSIDLSRCIGCGSCTIACQAENNIPSVGYDEVLRRREMNWLRIDRYFTGTDADHPGVVNMPVACVHCENAPCEYVCPVNATVHSDEGLNEMVYNRCVGTRYCSNNCPYKVRRFNWFNWHERDDETRRIDKYNPTEQMRYNPDVTVRARGVMEKCSYCVQRIERTRITARVEGRPIGHDEIVTACQQGCPTKAITFGDLNDKSSTAARLAGDKRGYKLLYELNTRPRTTHLARITNLNEALAKPVSAEDRTDHGGEWLGENNDIWKAKHD